MNEPQLCRLMGSIFGWRCKASSLPFRQRVFTRSDKWLVQSRDRSCTWGCLSLRGTLPLSLQFTCQLSAYLSPPNLTVPLPPPLFFSWTHSVLSHYVSPLWFSLSRRFTQNKIHVLFLVVPLNLWPPATGSGGLWGRKQRARHVSFRHVCPPGRQESFGGHVLWKSSNMIGDFGHIHAETDTQQKRCSWSHLKIKTCPNWCGHKPNVDFTEVPDIVGKHWCRAQDCSFIPASHGHHRKQSTSGRWGMMSLSCDLIWGFWLMRLFYFFQLSQTLPNFRFEMRQCWRNGEAGVSAESPLWSCFRCVWSGRII